MKELFEALPQVPFDRAKRYNLLDTCYVWHMLEHPKERKRMKARGSLAITSFTAKELEYTKKKVKSSDKHALREFLKESGVVIISLPVEPGQVRKEKAFVASIEPELLQHIPDASDAVIAAVALATKSDLYTKDKHHLFTAELENFLNEHNVWVYH
ncbi:hypothetical protein D6774_04605 [Candidatus Woesearchaeota archaeon]|nr:MAG: hypothetical protein D6774_04605 [Candidatus Woesearchaeota archaeon]